jgi:organic radical activating enzyme
VTSGIRSREVLRAWGRILRGYRPVLSIEITTACPLSCPGCYAFQPAHVSGAPLKSLNDLQGDALVGGILQLVHREKPIVLYLVGGEPLVRYRELDSLLPQLAGMGLTVHVVTSAVRPIPPAWAHLRGLTIDVSIDGLPAEHDRRRHPATYERVLKHIAGHRILVHCTVTAQMLEREGYLEEFARFWSQRPEVREIQFSLFTPQVGEMSAEVLSPEQRSRAVSELGRLQPLFPMLRLNQRMLEAFRHPPQKPSACAFARLTHTVSADLESRIEPCQFGGTPDCSRCGCLATMGLEAILGHRLPGGLRVRALLDASTAVGEALHRAGVGPRRLEGAAASLAATARASRG